MKAQERSLVLSEVFPPQKGGSGKWLWEIYRRQPAGVYAMMVGNQFGPDVGDDNYPQEVCRLKLDMPYRGVAKVNSLRHYAAQIKLVRGLAREKNVVMVHAARPLSEGLVARGVKLLTGIPYLCYIHGEDVNIASTSRELRMATKVVLSGAQVLIANSNFTKTLLVDEWDVSPEKVKLMHPGVDSARFADQTAQASELLEDKDLRLLTVGRLQERKGQDTVIRAIPALLQTFPRIQYVIAGDGEDKPRLVSLVRELGVSDQVRFEGEVDDNRLLQLYRECDVFVLANRSVGKDVEGFGIVLLEAQACGKPVIAGDSGGTRDTMLPGETGYLVNGQTPDELIQVLTSKLNDPSQRAMMGARGKDHVVSRFDWSSLAVEAEQVFQSVSAQTMNHRLRGQK